MTTLPTRAVLSTLRPPQWGALFSAALVPAWLSSQSPWSFSTPTLQSILDLLPPFLLAVPKKKVSHSRKSMRASNKGLKDKQNIVNCPACGAPKLMHHLCPGCYSTLTRGWKAQAKQQGDRLYSGIPEFYLGGDGAKKR